MKMVLGILTVFHTSFPALAGEQTKSQTGNTVLSTEATDHLLLTEKLCGGGAKLIQATQIPLDSFSFRFDEAGGQTRKGFILTLACDRIEPLPEYMSHVDATVGPTTDGLYTIYKLGIGNDFYVSKNKSINFFCNAKRPLDEGFRGCTVTFPIVLNDSGSPKGVQLVGIYGVDWENRRHIPVINEDVRRYVFTHLAP